MSEATIHQLRPNLKPFTAGEFLIACQTYFPPELQMRAMACYVGLCATHLQPGPNMICMCCGEAYRVQRPPQYCSAACRKRAWRERHSQKKSEAQS